MTAHREPREASVDPERHSIQELMKLRERMNRLFEESMGRYSVGDAGASWSPAVDIYDEDDRVVFEAELPGVSREEVEVEVEDGSLVLRGERKLDPELRSRDFHRMERAYGAFQRSFRLPRGVDAGGIQAEMNGGVLRVTLPRRGAESAAVRIRVE